jgi:transcriptional regulator GlxA family with amidase domain
MTNPPKPIRIAILIFPDVTISTAYGMFDLFKGVGRDWGFLTIGEPGTSLMQPELVAIHTNTFEASNGISITPSKSIHDFPDPDIVCVPDVFVPLAGEWAGRFEKELAYLRNAYARGATIATACSGALLLAEAGLLKGYEATTHWSYCDYLSRNYPDIKVHPQRALVASGEEQRLLMAGGGTSWLDLALLLIARWCSVEEAMHTARVYLINWHSIGQQPFAHLASPPRVDDAVIADCQVWIASHYPLPSPVAQMVQRSGLPERSFKRRFQQAAGMSPLEYVHNLRLEEAKLMLERNDQPIEAIANEVGYEDAGFFSRLFRRQVGITPAAYRKRFGGMRRMLAASKIQVIE